MNLTGKTRVLGIFGDPVAHSLSPLMQNQALEAAGFDAVYVPFHVRPDKLEQAVEGVRALALLGVNVTIPHKEKIGAYLDEIDEDAKLIGAINTVVSREGRLKGYNTDGLGLIRSLSEDLEFDPRGKRILILGAGGACRAALVSLSRAGAASISIANRTKARAEELSREFGAVFAETDYLSMGLCQEDLSIAVEGVDLVLNTTSIGLKGEVFEDFPWDKMSKETSIYDMVYKPGKTPLVNEAIKKGYLAADGLGMLAGQGEEAFYLWTGDRPEAGLMKACLLSETQGK